MDASGPRVRQGIAAALLLLLPLVTSADVLAGGAALVGLLHGDHHVALRADAAHFDVVMLHEADVTAAPESATTLTCGQEHAHDGGAPAGGSSSPAHRVHVFVKGLGAAGIATTHAAPPAPTLAASALPGVASGVTVRMAGARDASHVALTAKLEALRTVVLRS